MVQNMEIMVDDMTYQDVGYIDESYMGMEMLPYDEIGENQEPNNVLVLSLVIGICVTLGIVLGIVLGRRAAKK